MPLFEEAAARIPPRVVGRFVAFDAAVEVAARAWGPGLGRALERHLLRFEAGGPCLRRGRSVSRERLARVVEGADRHDALAEAIEHRVTLMAQAIELGSNASRLDEATFVSMHQLLLQGDPGAGLLRRGPTVLGRHQPPSPERLRPGLVRLSDWLAGPSPSASLRAALVHAELVNLHPFADGNGRMGRALSRVVLRRALGRHPAPLPFWSCLAFTPTPFSVSNAAYRRGNPEPWLASMAGAMTSALAIAGRLQDRVRRVRGSRSAGKLGHRALIRQLWSTPLTTSAALATRLGARTSAIERSLIALQRRGRVERLADGCTWKCTSMLGLLDAWDRELSSLS